MLLKRSMQLDPHLPLGADLQSRLNARLPPRMPAPLLQPGGLMQGGGRGSPGPGSPGGAAGAAKPVDGVGGAQAAGPAEHVGELELPVPVRGAPWTLAVLVERLHALLRALPPTADAHVVRYIGRGTAGGVGVEIGRALLVWPGGDGGGEGVGGGGGGGDGRGTGRSGEEAGGAPPAAVEGGGGGGMEGGAGGRGRGEWSAHPELGPAISEALAFWAGAAEAGGVAEADAWKCRRCDFRERCSRFAELQAKGGATGPGT
jgi:hypothetical protein